MPTQPENNPAFPEGEGGEQMLTRMNSGAHEQLAQWGLSFIDLRYKMFGLDVGCGGGANIERLLNGMPRGTVDGIDHSNLAVRMSCEHNAQAIDLGRCRVQYAEVEHLPFAKESFDIVTGFETIYFWRDALSGLKEIHRVLKPAGELLICNETNGENPEVIEFAKSIPGMQVYNATGFKSMFKNAGFSKIDIHENPETGALAVIGTK